jgi:uncharacterized protein YbjT (DUF2867 family)
MKILVTTPGGTIGRRVLLELLAPEFTVRVISRNPGRLPREIRAQAETIAGSIDDATTLATALDGVDALFWCVPAESARETDVRSHYERFARSASRAIRSAGTARVVTVSAGGKGAAENAGPVSHLHLMEDIVNESGAAIRHLRCGWLMENFLWQAGAIAQRGTLSYPVPGEVPFPMVAATDIADAALRWLARGDWNGIEGVAVHGPEDLSFTRASAIFEKILERPVSYQEASANQYVQTLTAPGASPEYARSMVDMFSALAKGILRAEPRTARTSTPTKLADWAATELLPLIDSLAAGSGFEPADGCRCGV